MEITTLFALMNKAGITEVRINEKLFLDFLDYRANSGSIVVDYPFFMGIKILNLKNYDRRIIKRV